MYIFFVFIFFISCSHSHEHDYIGVVDSVVGKEIKKIRKEEDLDLFGYGGGMCDGIKRISVIFASYQKTDIAHARVMVVRAIERIRDAVNANEDLKEHLVPYPFPTNGVKVGIVFLQKSGRFIEYGCAYLGTGGVSSVFQQNGMIFYDSFNPRTGLLEDYFKETYEEALAIVNGEGINDCCEELQLEESVNAF